MKKLMNTLAGKVTRFAVEAIVGVAMSALAIKHGKDLLFEKVSVEEIIEESEGEVL